MKGFAAIVFCGAIASCSHDMDSGSDAVQSKVQETYEKAFVTRFGEPAATQTWGFGSTTAAKTRALRNDLAGQSWIRNFAKAGTRDGNQTKNISGNWTFSVNENFNPADGETQELKVNDTSGNEVVLGFLTFHGNGGASQLEGDKYYLSREGISFTSYGNYGQVYIKMDGDWNDSYYCSDNGEAFNSWGNKWWGVHKNGEQSLSGNVQAGHTYKVWYTNSDVKYYAINIQHYGDVAYDNSISSNSGTGTEQGSEQQEGQQGSEQQEEQQGSEQQEEQQGSEQQEEQQGSEQQGSEQQGSEQGTGSTTTIFSNNVTTCTVTDDYDAVFTKAYYEAIKENMPELNQTTGERDYEFVSAGPFEFSIIFSNTSSAVCDKVGYYYYREEDGIASRTEVQFKDETTSPTTYFQFTKNSGEGDYYWETPGTQSGYQILDWGAQYVRAKVFTIDVPVGYRVGFWIENTCSNYPRFYSNQSLNQDGEHYSAVVDLDDDTFLVGLEDWLRAHGGDNDCNDIIISVNKGTTPPEIIIPSDDNDPQDETNEIVVIGEDLTIDDVKPDFDFNDVVFKVTWNKTQNKVTVKLLAAGGTLPLYVDGKEIHAEFAKVNPDKVIVTTTMINTAKNAHYAYKTPSFEVENPSGTTIEEIAANIDVYAVKFGEPVRLAAPTGGVPSKIAVMTDFLNAGWCDEREDIDEKFTDNGTPLFKNYVQGNLDDNWYTKIKIKNNQ